jgi:hypothetical protein
MSLARVPRQWSRRTEYGVTFPCGLPAVFCLFFIAQSRTGGKKRQPVMRLCRDEKIRCGSGRGSRCGSGHGSRRGLTDIKQEVFPVINSGSSIYFACKTAKANQAQKSPVIPPYRVIITGILLFCKSGWDFRRHTKQPKERFGPGLYGPKFLHKVVLL